MAAVNLERRAVAEGVKRMAVQGGVRAQPWPRKPLLAVERRPVGGTFGTRLFDEETGFG